MGGCVVPWVVAWFAAAWVRVSSGLDLSIYVPRGVSITRYAPSMNFYGVDMGFYDIEMGVYEIERGL